MQKVRKKDKKIDAEKERGKEEFLILVDEKDTPIGLAEKMDAHLKGLLHRAFSIFIMRAGASGPELLLQKRAACKYHSPGLWTNSCCSHPRKGETPISAGMRRLKEEFGFEVPLKKIGAFTYHAELGNGLIEHEYDHVLIGHYKGEEIMPNPKEIADYRWLPLNATEKELKEAPERFTAWFGKAFQIVKNHCNAL